MKLYRTSTAPSTWKQTCCQRQTSCRWRQEQLTLSSPGWKHMLMLPGVHVDIAKMRSFLISICVVFKQTAAQQLYLPRIHQNSCASFRNSQLWAGPAQLKSWTDGQQWNENTNILGLTIKWVNCPKIIVLVLESVRSNLNSCTKFVF